MRRPSRRAVFLTIAAAALVPGLLLAQQPIFRAQVDLVAVDTQVIDRDGAPIGNLAAKNFQVWINGQVRRVVSADLIQYPLAVPRSIVPSFFEQPDLVRSDVPEVRGRIIVLVIDEMSFSAQALPRVIDTAKRFLTTLPPDDVIGLYAYPFGPARLDLTHYHNTVAVALNRLHGLQQGFGGEFVRAGEKLRKSVLPRSSGYRSALFVGTRIQELHLAPWDHCAGGIREYTSEGGGERLAETRNCGQKESNVVCHG
jgi:hypothetical protein